MQIEFESPLKMVPTSIYLCLMNFRSRSFLSILGDLSSFFLHESSNLLVKPSKPATVSESAKCPRSVKSLSLLALNKVSAVFT